MLDHSKPLTVYGAIWTNDRVGSRCCICGRLHGLDLQRLALNGLGRYRLSAIPFECECGSRDYEVIAERQPGG